MSNLELMLLAQINASGLPVPVTEYKFHPDRRWRFDFCWPDDLLAVEVEGGTWVNGRHNRGSGFEKDAEKYAEALCLGWKVLRVTGSHICTGKAIKWIRRLMSLPFDQQDTEREDMLNATHICARFNISRLKLTKLLQEGKFPAPTSQLGMFKFWTPESVEGWTPPAKPVKEKKPTIVKYRDGENTWAGRGKMATWLKKHVEAGRSIDEFKV